MSINIIIILDYYSTQHDMTLDCVVLVSLLSCLLFIVRSHSSHVCSFGRSLTGSDNAP